MIMLSNPFSIIFPGMIALSNSFSLIFLGMIMLSNSFSNSSFIILLFHPLWKIHPDDSTFSKMYAEKKPDKVDPNEPRLSKWPKCMLSNEPLREPFVIDKLGNILNKEAFVEVLKRTDLEYMLRQTELDPSMRKELRHTELDPSMRKELRHTELDPSMRKELRHTELDPSMRKELIGWLIESRLEETVPFKVQDLCSLTNGFCTEAQVVEGEYIMLESLGYELCDPNADYFIRRYMRAAHASYEKHIETLNLDFVTKFLAELTITDYGFLKYLPSKIAASSIFLVRWTVFQAHHPWNRTLISYTKYKASELKESVIKLQQLQKSREENDFANNQNDYRVYRDFVLNSIDIPDVVFLEYNMM
ncbi:hypothetical protein RYX36_028505 [Vicia faba]